MIIHSSHAAEVQRTLTGIVLLALAMLVVLLLPSPHGVSGMANYLPLHLGLETVAIVIAGLVFAVGWNAKQHQLSSNILLLSAVFLGVGLLDFSHTLSYAGMPSFITPSDPEKAINFWLSARTLAALGLLAVAWLPWGGKSMPPRSILLAVVLFVVAVLHALFLFYPQHVPRTFVAGQGLTGFKLAYEYGLILAYLAAAVLFLAAMRKPRNFNASGLFATACLAAMSEFFFTRYADVTDIYNLFGHIYKIAAYLFLYRAIFVETVQYPYEQLNASRNQLQATLDTLPDLLFEIDAEGRFMEVHASNPDMLAAPEHVLVGKNLREVLPEAVAKVGFAALAEAREYGYSRGHRIELDVPLGKHWFELSVGRKNAGPGQEPTYLVLSRNVTSLVNQQLALEWEDKLNIALLKLPAEAEERSEQGFMQYGIDQIEKLTGSRVGFIHFVNDDQESIELVSWSSDTLALYCRAEHERHYPISQAGIWADAFRQRRPVVFNDYADAPNRHGLPQGHAELSRLISVPVIDGGLVRMMVGVGNKPELYTDKDVGTVQLMADAVWRIVNKRRLDDVLSEQREELNSFFTANLDLFCIANVQGEFVRLNPEFERVLGYPIAELEGRNFFEYVHPDDRAATLKTLEALARQEEVYGFENRFRCRNGGYRDIEWRATPRGNRIYASARDVTERKLREAEMRKLSLAVEQNPFPIVITDLQANIEYVNRAFTQITGYEAHEALGRNPGFLKSGKTKPEIYVEMWSRLQRGEPWQGELVNLRKDGKEYTESVLIYPVRNADGTATHYLAHIEDVTAKKSAAERIRHLSNYDQLTGLPNRAMLEERFNYSLEMVRQQGGKLSLMWIDLDNFKDINDALGHAVGDLLLREVASRLHALLREQDTLSRQSGDDFVLVMPGADQNEAALMVTRLMSELSRPILLGNRELIITASVGIAVYPHDGDSLTSLLICSEAAMYRVKDEGRNSYCFFEPDMQEGTSRMLEMSTALKQALNRNEFYLVYQPQIDLKTGDVAGAEALLRWRHPRWGDVSPTEFVPIAENSGLVVQIGEWVLRTVARQVKAWEASGMPPLAVAVNISALHFAQPAFADTVAQLVREAGVAAAAIEIELTEAAAMKHPEDASRVMEELVRKGFRLSLDDFGTGYSSLSYLKRFAVDKLKIDQSFIRDVGTNPDDQALVTAIIQMAHSLGIKAIAEGVETLEQLAFLGTRECDQIQGYVYSRPLAPEQFEAFVRNGRLAPAQVGAPPAA